MKIHRILFLLIIPLASSCSDMIADHNRRNIYPFFNFNAEIEGFHNGPCPDKAYSTTLTADLNGTSEVGATSVVFDCYYAYVGGFGPTPYMYKINLATHETTYAAISYTAYDSVLVGDYIWTVGATSPGIQKINKHTLNVEWSNISEPNDARSITFDGTYLWSADRGIARRLHRINPSDNTITSYTGIIGDSARRMCFDGKYIWVTCSGANSVLRIDPADRSVTTIGSITAAWGICYTGKYIIVAGATGYVAQIDPASATVTNSTTLLNCLWLCHCGYDGRYAWITDIDRNEMKIINPETLALVNTQATQSRPFNCTYDGKYMWIIMSAYAKIMKLTQ